MKLYLITTDHMETKVWFREEADYVAGMNYVAVAVGSTRVMIVAFILMSNHVHFLIVGTYLPLQATLWNVLLQKVRSISFLSRQCGGYQGNTFFGRDPGKGHCLCADEQRCRQDMP